MADNDKLEEILLLHELDCVGVRLGDGDDEQEGLVLEDALEDGEGVGVDDLDRLGRDPDRVCEEWDEERVAEQERLPLENSDSETVAVLEHVPVGICVIDMLAVKDVDGVRDRGALMDRVDCVADLDMLLETLSVLDCEPLEVWVHVTDDDTDGLTLPSTVGTGVADRVGLSDGLALNEGDTADNDMVLDHVPVNKAVIELLAVNDVEGV